MKLNDFGNMEIMEDKIQQVEKVSLFRSRLKSEIKVKTRIEVVPILEKHVFGDRKGLVKGRIHRCV